VCQIKSDYPACGGIVGVTVGHEIGVWPSKGVAVETVPGGLIMPGERKIEEIWVELAL